ncbi:MAG: hypothetical protein IJ889_05105 [Eubacterium sp.]|nr:hypothetical protein [Eubacterium sp.]
MASKRKKRKRRNRIIITVATLLIIFCVVCMIFVAIEGLGANSSEGTKFLIMEIPLAIAIVMIFFIAKDRIR